jgi:multisubunit Na+/H+ antiporter MnhE subunit
MKRLPEILALGLIAGGGFASYGLVILTALFTLSVPFHEAIEQLFQYSPTHLEMVIGILVTIALFVLMKNLVVVLYMISLLSSLWFLAYLDWTVWLAPALITTMISCPLLVFFTKRLFGKEDF